MNSAEGIWHTAHRRDWDPYGTYRKKVSRKAVRRPRRVHGAAGLQRIGPAQLGPECNGPVSGDRERVWFGRTTWSARRTARGIAKPAPHWG